jgi:hypothetical protein
MFVSCTQHAGAARASGSCPFVVPAGLAAGTYQLRLLANDGFAVRATSNNFTVTTGGGGSTTLSVAPTSSTTLSVAPASGPTLSVAPSSVAAGGSVTASWSNIASPTSTDWIGLYSPAAANNAFHATSWMFVSCTHNAGAARASGSCSFVVPAGLAAGTYQLRLLANDSFAVLATSNNFTVTTGGGGSSPSGGSVSAVFTPSADHNTLVRHYVLDIFPSSADPTVANAVLSVDLGKPSVVNGECYVDITAVLAQLWPGTFIGTVSAIGDEGGAQSEPSAAFVIP